MNDTFSLRQARPDDATSIAEVQVAVWNSAYRGLVPDALIDQLRVPDRAEMWTKILESYAATGRGAVIVAEEAGVIVGFASCGDQRDPDLVADYPGEISAIYVAQPRRGIGAALMAEAARALIAMGHEAAALWVLSDNRAARHFYEHLGGQPVRERIDEAEEGSLNEVAYGWATLTSLTAR